MTQPRSLTFPRNDKVLKFSFLMLSLLLLYCHCERQRSNPVKSCKILPAPLRGGTEFPTIYCRWNDGGGGSVAGLNPPTQAILMALSHHKYRCPAPLGGRCNTKVRCARHIYLGSGVEPQNDKGGAGMTRGARMTRGEFTSQNLRPDRLFLPSCHVRFLRLYHALISCRRVKHNCGR